MKRCIFCEEPSGSSKSVEHIIPESLGNEEHTLERGIVCDACNNYFSIKIEGPLLSSLHFRNLRSRQFISNKRGRIPPQEGLFPLGRMPINLHPEIDGSLSVSSRDERDSPAFVRALMHSNKGTFLFPLSAPIDRRLLARFLGKIGVEIVAQRVSRSEGLLNELIENEAMSVIREFVRRGSGPAEWPYSQRRIYAEGLLFGEGVNSYEVLHEYDLLITKENEYYAVVCLFGEEFTINLGGPSIDGYLRWLESNNHRSPLYP